MRPAFSSSWQALGFVLLLLGILVFPGWVARTGWLERAQVHVTRNWQHGPFPWTDWQIHQRTNVVDIAFLGSSRMWAGINAGMVKEQLSARLGRPAEVLVLGWNWAGYDGLYAVAQDLLSHRAVRMLVIFDEVDFQNGLPHPYSFYWHRPGADEAAARLLPWIERVRLYAGSLLVTPRLLLSTFLPYRPLAGGAAAGPEATGQFTAKFLAELERAGGSLLKRVNGPGRAPFEPYAPVISATGDELRIFGADGGASLSTAGPITPPYQEYWARQLGQVCRQRGTRLAMLHLPLPAELGQAMMRERDALSALGGGTVRLLGLPGANVFDGLGAEEVKRLYYDPVHLNANGANHFTRLIAPALVRLYAESTNRH